jgi:hypothetical protein
MVAYNAEQTEELAYGALKIIIEECDDAGMFDTGGRADPAPGRCWPPRREVRGPVRLPERQRRRPDDVPALR